MLACLQSVPGGKPSLLEPSLIKQDITQMVKDLPKYHETGLFPPDTREKWDNFKLLSGFSSVYGSIPSPEPEWILTNLKPVSTTPVISDSVLKHSRAAKQTRKVNDY